MSKRRKARNTTRKSFSRTAKKVHKKNGTSRPMRGGYRL